MIDTYQARLAPDDVEGYVEGDYVVLVVVGSVALLLLGEYERFLSMDRSLGVVGLRSPSILYGSM